ncbi:MAG: hypothetical protein ABL308_06525 [Oceanicaulis sp.]
MLAMVTLVAGLPAAGAVATAPETGQAAVLFNPALTDAELAAAAASSGAAIVRFGALPGSLVVDLPDARAKERLRAAGAWMIADPVVLGGCSASQDGDLGR